MTSGSSAARDPPGSTRPRRARALLLVVIMEFVWPTGQPDWSSTLSEDRLRLLCSDSMRLTFSLLEPP